MVMLLLVAVSVLFSDASVLDWTGQQPQLAGSESRTFLTFLRENTIVVRRSTDGGRSFEELPTIRPTGQIAAGMRRGPRVAVTKRAVIVSAIVGAQGRGKDGDVMAYRSTDEGRSWSDPIVINDVPGSAREGLHALAANDGGVVALAWLDLRQPGTRVYAAISRDDGTTWSGDVLAYESPSGSVCECCHPSLLVGPDGRVAVMFRNHVGDSRDMYLGWSNDAGHSGAHPSFRPAVKLGEGTWHLAACPMDGGGAVISSGGVTTVWRREDGVFLTPASGPEQRVGTGSQPVAAVSGSELALAWVTSDGLLVRRADRTTTLEPGHFPSILASRDYTLVATEHDGSVTVRRLDR
jgi:hypothetical protein